MQANSLQRPEPRHRRLTGDAALPVLIVLLQLLASLHAGVHADHDTESEASPQCTVCAHGDRLEGSPPAAHRPALPVEPAIEDHPASNPRRPLPSTRLHPPTTGPPA